MIKSFRGLIASGEQDTIRVGTVRGELGYRINKFQIISQQPGTQGSELTCKLWAYEQLDSAGNPDVDSLIDFSNSELLGVAYQEHNSATNSQESLIVIFDNTVFNQDIYVTAFDDGGSSLATNYYLELEQVKLDVNEAGIATLKDMRSN